MSALLVVAVEASADVHGASVLRELRGLVPDLRVFGAGGPRLRAEGCETLVRAEDLSVMGVVDVVPAIPRILRSLGALRRAAEELRPGAALLIDSPDFNLRLAKRLRALGVPVVYFIGPTVWAWRSYRVRQIARDVLRMLVILPFEAAFYARSGVHATYVGNPVADAIRSPHPLPAQTPSSSPACLSAPACSSSPAPVDSLGQTESGPGHALADAAGRAELRRVLGLHPDRPVLALLPGSRRQEIRRIFPRMLEAAGALRERVSGLQLIVPVAPTLDREELSAQGAADGVVFVPGRAFEVLRACDAAIVTSGTATLEAALAGAPAVVVYRTSWLNWLIGRLLVRVRHLALPNLLAGRAVMPELLQSRCTGDRIADRAAPLLDPQSPERARQVEDLRRVRDELAPMGSPSAARRVAEEVAKILGQAG